MYADIKDLVVSIPRILIEFILSFIIHSEHEGSESIDAAVMFFRSGFKAPPNTQTAKGGQVAVLQHFLVNDRRPRPGQANTNDRAYCALSISDALYLGVI